MYMSVEIRLWHLELDFLNSIFSTIHVIQILINDITCISIILPETLRSYIHIYLIFTSKYP